MAEILLKVLYKTVPGRLVLKGLTAPGLSRMAGTLLYSELSGRFVPWYIRKHNIDMNDIDIPADGYNSFNEFFTRKRREEQPITSVAGTIISPCDVLLSVVPIHDNSTFRIKNTEYSLHQLLVDSELTEAMRGGLALIFRLTPQHYHRYCYSTDGIVLHSRKINGRLHCVRPVALESAPVFIQNCREYQLIWVANKRFMVHMEIGALLVGKIRNNPLHDGFAEVHAGEEKGYFEFGGSTVVLLFEKDMVQLDCIPVKGTESQEEYPVHLGQQLGRILL